MTVGVGDLAVSGEAGDVVVTHALGSCVAVVVRDRATGVCGMAHVVVPGDPPVGATAKPAFHANAAIRNLLAGMRQLGGASDLRVSLVGGAAVVEALTTDVGRRNVMAVRRALWAHGLVPAAEDVGGTMCRTVSVDIPSGTVRISNPTMGTWTLEQEQR